MADCPQTDHDLLVAHLARFEEYIKAMEDRLGKLNELREQTSEFQSQYLRYDVYTARHKELEQKIDAMQAGLTQKIEANFKNHDDKIDLMTTAQSNMLGMGQGAWAMIVLAVGVLAAWIGHVWR